MMAEDIPMTRQLLTLNKDDHNKMLSHVSYLH